MRCNPKAEAQPVVRLPFHPLYNPVFSLPGLSVKDPAIVTSGAETHLLFSGFDRDGCHVYHTATTDWLHWLPARQLFSTKALGAVGTCSPDVTFHDGTWYCVFHTWGSFPDHPNKLYVTTSRDGTSWTQPELLNVPGTGTFQLNDGALMYWDSRWYLCSKNGPRTDGPYVYVSDDLDRWTPTAPIEEGPAKLSRRDGKQFQHENYQWVPIGGRPHLLSTDFPGHHACLYRPAGDVPSCSRTLRKWEDGYALAVPSQSFNDWDGVNAAVLVPSGDLGRGDRRTWMMVFAGTSAQRSPEDVVFEGRKGYRPWDRGWNRLGVAVSPDLETWTTPSERRGTTGGP